MIKQQIEWRVLQIAERVKARHPIEDSLVELKTEWPEPRKFGRRLAAHANAARGEPILWLIGIDEKRSIIVGAAEKELADWWPQVQAEFDGRTAPSLMFVLNVAVDIATVVALLFETDRSPYVILNPDRNTPDAGPIDREVPWRDGNRTRSASRAELLQMLVPSARLPDFEILDGEVIVQEQKRNGIDTLVWVVELGAYVVPRIDGLTVFPFHQCGAFAEVSGVLAETRIEELRMGPEYTSMGVPTGGLSRRISETIDSTISELLVSGPGMLLIDGHFLTPVMSIPEHQIMRVRISMRPCGTDTSAQVEVRLVPTDKKGDRFRWRVKKD